MKFLVKKLSKEFNFRVNDKNVIEHGSLMAFLESKEVGQFMPTIDVPLFPYVTENAATCLVRIVDIDGEHPYAIGEANPSNLNNKMAKEYPHTMAYKRAIERAILDYLGIEDGRSSTKEAKPEQTETPVIPLKKEEEEKAVDVVPEEKKVLTEDEKKRLHELYDIVAMTGKHKGKTLKQIFVDEGYVNWLCNEKTVIKTDEYKQLQSLVRELKALKEAM